jgi:hypothetical protein
MLQFLRDGSRARRLRLFAVACCRRVANIADSDTVAVAERAADGLATEEELAQARAESERAYGLSVGQFSYVPPPPDVHVEGAVMAVASPSAPDAAASASGETAAFVGDGELRAQAALLRDIFGNPFRPVAFSPEWRTDTAVALARQMYEAREFSAMPILADALQDAGCDSAEILDHCRGPGPHVRGCWVVDLVLGKE